tara:strand:- start:284 stop:499 length:216 start_codon:yes stop_codon:yes gene_type:complete
MWLPGINLSFFAGFKSTTNFIRSDLIPEKFIIVFPFAAAPYAATFFPLSFACFRKDKRSVLIFSEIFLFRK